ncbi:hypothetical protein MALV_55360 (plasmid) [Mycolicibacterium alvei]|uniref:Uncharacterized protein n=1 Tax=Mycolicibacterium alvei TaxID=67081 RepID=A0A6N4V427_9MYCO|nr:hypothetical protein MALV_55360 [Mycolicibacterium alvei]
MDEVADDVGLAAWPVAGSPLVVVEQDTNAPATPATAATDNHRRGDLGRRSLITVIGPPRSRWRTIAVHCLGEYCHNLVQPPPSRLKTKPARRAYLPRLSHQHTDRNHDCDHGNRDTDDRQQIGDTGARGAAKTTC